MAVAMDLMLFINSESSDNHKRLEPTFIPDYRNFAFTKSELKLLENEVIAELYNQCICSDILNSIVTFVHVRVLLIILSMQKKMCILLLHDVIL